MHRAWDCHHILHSRTLFSIPYSKRIQELYPLEILNQEAYGLRETGVDCEVSH